MKIIEVPRMQTAMAENIGHVRALSRRPGPITALPELTYVRPKVMIEARHVAAYSKVCGFTRAHGVPMLYPHLQAFPLAMRFMISRNFPWPTMGMVHLANRARQYQRIDVGDELRYEMDTGELQAHEKGQVVVLHARALRAGELVWDSSWYLLRLAVRNTQGVPFESSLQLLVQAARVLSAATVRESPLSCDSSLGNSPRPRAPSPPRVMSRTSRKISLLPFMRQLRTCSGWEASSVRCEQ